MKRFSCRGGAAWFAAAALAVVVLAHTGPARGQGEKGAAKAEAAAERKGLTKVRSVEGFTEYKLDNGVQVLLYPDPSASKVTVNLTVFAGSRHEGYGETGMAHLLEHMVFKGCKKFADVPKALRDHGADFNGTTWYDRTNYYETMPATDANLEFGIELEADRLVNSFIRRDDLASEMTVVRNEFEMGENNPQAILSQRMMASAFEWHNYGKSTIGNRSDIERVPIDRLQAFYRKFYQPDNVMLIVAGKFDEKKALDYILKHFGPLKRPTRKLDTTYTQEPAQDGERSVVLRRVGKVGCVGAVYHIPAGAHPDFPALEVLSEALTAEPAGRLYKALVLTKKATEVGSEATGLHDPGMFEVIAQTDLREEPKLRAVLESLLEVTEGLPKNKLTDEEVERARKKLLKQRELLMNSPQRVAINLSEWASKGDWRLFLLHRDRLEKVATADVNRVAEKYLKRSNRTSGIFVPTDAPARAAVPDAPKVASLLEGYKGRAAVALGEAFDPTPLNIEKRLQRAKWGPDLRVALLPKKTRNAAVVVNMVVHFGNEKSLKGNVTAAEFLGALMRRGAKDLTRQKLTDELDRLKAQLSVSSNPGQINVQVVCKRDTLAEVTALLKKVLREPTFPADELDVLKRQQLEQLQQAQTDPTRLGITALRRAIAPHDKDDVRYVPTAEEGIARVKGLTAEQIRKLYAEQVGGENVDLALVGDFDPDEATKLYKGLLEGWKTDTKYARVNSVPDVKVKGQKLTINVPDKENALFAAGHAVDLKDTDPGYEAVRVGSFLVGEAPLSSRISNRVRGKDGLSYGAGGTVRGGSQDRSGVFLLFAITAPSNITKVNAAVQDELAKLAKEGISESELADGINAYLAQEKTQRGSDAAIAGEVTRDLRLGRTYEFHAEREKKIQGLTTKEVTEALKKVIDPKRLVIVFSGDLKKDGEKGKKEEGKK